MAEPISIQQLKDASEDAISLAEFINKPENVMIPRRLASDIHSLQYYLEYMKSFAQRSYETYDEMVANASNLSENVSVFVTNDSDTSKNGIYTYNGTSFVKGEYQPENAAKEFVETKLEGLPPFEGGVLADTFVTVTAQGVDMVARTQRDKNSENINAKDFGAKGDGITDNAIDLNKAFSYADKSIIYIPDGNYIVNSDLLIGSNKHIIGSANSTLTIRGSIKMTGVSNITLSNLRLVFDYSVRCMEITDCNNITISECFINGKGFDGDTPLAGVGASSGIVIRNSKNTRILNNEICNFRLGKGVEFAGSENIWVINNYVHHTGRAGISISNTNTNSWVVNNRVRKNVANFSVDDGAIDLYGPNNYNTWILNNVVTEYGSEESTAIGIRIKGSKNTYCISNSVDSGFNGFAAIYVQDRYGEIDENVWIDRNTITLKPIKEMAYMIRVTVGININITNNTLTSEDSNFTATPKAIEIRSNVIGLNIRGNILKGMNDTPLNCDAGILIHNGGVRYENVKINDNYVYTMGTPIVADLMDVFSVEGNTLKKESETNGLLYVRDSSIGYVKDNIYLGTASAESFSGNTGVIIGKNLHKKPDGSLFTGEIIEPYPEVTIAAGESVTTRITNVNIKLGDVLVASYSSGLRGSTLNAYVAKKDTVDVVHTNPTSEPMTFVEGTIKIKVV